MKKLGFGLMRLPYFGNNPADVDVEQAKKMVDLFIIIKKNGTVL